MEVAGQVIEGAQNIFFAQLADPNTTQFAVSATRFMSGKFPLMIFGLPGAALAMYRTADSKKKKAAGGLLLSAALTSMLTGITEPLEFTFLFVAPLLYGVHCVFAGLAYMLMHVFNVGVGMTFSGGFIDMFLFGILQGNDKTNWIWIVIVGIVYFIVYYFLFSFLIRRFDLKTPGREDADEVKLYRRSDVDAKGKKFGRKDGTPDEMSVEITMGLGGKKNISDVDCCATRLRCTVFDSSLVKEDVLRATGASGVIRKGTGVQVIYGPRVSVIKSNLEDYLESAEEEMAEEMEVREQEEAPERNRQPAVTISSPITGKAAPLSEAPDEGFSGGMMGDGVVVTPEEPIVHAPADGTVTFIFDTKHAIGFETKEGVELLIHIGIDTVKLKGKGFEVFVAEGQRVKKGQKLMRLDLTYLKENAPSLVSPVLCPELTEYQRVRLLKEGSVKAGEDLFVIEENE